MPSVNSTAGSVICSLSTTTWRDASNPGYIDMAVSLNGGDGSINGNGASINGRDDAINGRRVSNNGGGP
eukprot:3831001-Rhodomonas_salina.2